MHRQNRLVPARIGGDTRQSMRRMSNESWRRHASPWSVYTRFAAIPVMIVAIWGRLWLGVWALVPVAALVVWLVLNPFVFPAVRTPRSWASKGIYGERLWLSNRSEVARTYRIILRRLILLGMGLLYEERSRHDHE